MILDLPRFIATERPYWDELAALVSGLENDGYKRLSIDQVQRLQYLYARALSALGKLSSFSGDPQTREYLESIVARAYANCHPQRKSGSRIRFGQFFAQTFPQTFRKHARAFSLAVALTVAGTGFGAGALVYDHNSKPILMPFSHLLGSPAERVKQEEADKGKRLTGGKASFSAMLMANNIKVSLLTFALGALYGVGSVAVVFYNGVTLGAVAADYVQAGYTTFLLGWLMPHGVIEIPAILVAGQAAFVLAGALIGWGDGSSRRKRIRAVSGDVLTLVGGCAVMLVWAGIVEAFLSQYHYPVIPYAAKIAFGACELIGLTLYLMRAGRKA